MSAKKIFLLVFFIISLFIPTLAQNPTSQSPMENENTIKINTELVNFDIQVLNKKTGNPLSGLTIDKFEVYENGVKQELTNFSQDKLPLSVLIMLDVSGSVENISPELKKATIKALSHLKPEDEACLMAFASGTGALNSFTRNKEIIIDNFDKISLGTKALGRGTNFNSSVSEAITHIKQLANPNNRKVIIVITDNMLLNPSPEKKQQVITTLLESGITVSGLLIKDFIGINPFASRGGASSSINSFTYFQPEFIAGASTGIDPRGAYSKAPRGQVKRAVPRSNASMPFNQNFNAVRSLALTDAIDSYVQETGGEIIDARGASIEEKFVKTIEHLRASYSVGYVSSNAKNDGKLRKLKVKLISNGKEIKDVAIKSRRGYFTAKDE